MLADIETFIGILKFASKHKIDTHGWQEEHAEKLTSPPMPYSAWVNRSGGKARIVEEATSADIAAVCFNVARWLKDEHAIFVRKSKRGIWRQFSYYQSPFKDKPLDCADNEPAALLAACQEMEKE